MTSDERNAGTSGAGHSALILFAHGSRDPDWAAPFRAVQQKIAARRPALAVELAFLELMQPSLPDAVDRLTASGRTHISVAPIFMAQGAHLKRDLAALMSDLRARHPHVEFALLPAAGEAEPVIEAMSEWLAGACR